MAQCTDLKRACVVVFLCRHNAKKGKCAVCEEPTHGIFNIATDVLKKMKKAKDKG
jgi:hypothetical protein